MNSIPITIPAKNDDTPLQLSIPKMRHLDKVARTLIGSGLGLALAGAISTLLKDCEQEDTPPVSAQKEETSAQ